MSASWAKFNPARHVFDHFFTLIEVCQVLFNCGGRDMQISKLICFISSLSSILGVLCLRSILKSFLDFDFCLKSSETRRNIRNEFETEYPE